MCPAFQRSAQPPFATIEDRVSKQLRCCCIHSANRTHDDDPEICPQTSNGVPCLFQVCGIRETLLFGDDFNCADRRVVDCGSEVDLYFALWRRFDVLEGFD